MQYLSNWSFKIRRRQNIQRAKQDFYGFNKKETGGWTWRRGVHVNAWVNRGADKVDKGIFFLFTISLAWRQFSLEAFERAYGPQNIKNGGVELAYKTARASSGMPLENSLWSIGMIISVFTVQREFYLLRGVQIVGKGGEVDDVLPSSWIM